MKRKIVLACTNCLRRNYKTNKSSNNDVRLSLQKFCPNCRSHTMHKEEK